MLKIVKKLIPASLRNFIREARIPFIISFLYRKELDKFIENSNFLNQEMIASNMLQHGVTSKWAGMYISFGAVVSREYVDEDFFQTYIIPKMNNMRMCYAYSDKNFYDITPLKTYTPQAVIRRIRGKYFDANYNYLNINQAKELILANKEKIILKPSIETDSGRGVVVAESYQIAEILKDSGNNFIVQECLQNNEFFKNLNPTSFNTIRCMTAFTGEEYVVLSSALRIGRKGVVVDNQNLGGIVIGINNEGALHDFALDKNLSKHYSHPDNGFTFKNTVIPGYQDIIGACINMHKYLPNFGLISWDVSIDNNNNVRIIEFNLNWQGINLLQYSNGPLFGVYREKIMDNYNIKEWAK